MCKDCANPIFSVRISVANELSAVVKFACRPNLSFLDSEAAWAATGLRS